ncbi:GlxA family transcriptional regulator [Fodinicola acaciae]|uniref:GlxA family transcriptional regulator n=1 Tax=Fodinicola acaciae TaxID=2681555 RepID=UPI0013D3DE2D|nr:GlxA family transcriptional regulator [Fodinicola acaciae]
MRSQVRRVVLVAYPGVQLLDVVGPAEVFNGASRTVKSARYELTIATPDGQPVAGESGLRLQADARLSDLDGPIDTLLVAGGWSYREAMGCGELLAQINRLAPSTRRVGSVCSGAFVLAQAGLLDGRAATTHWAVCQRLQSQFPAIRVEPDRIFVRDGDVFTSAGVTAGMDLALALVEADHGVEVARTVARWMVVFVQRPGGQSQFSERLAHAVSPDSPLRTLLDEIVADPAADHTVPRLAERAALSERHLTRLFVVETGTTPGRFVERSRVEAAREALESGPTPVEAVARRVGFGSAETMRRAFLRVLGIGPADYRARFSGTHLRPARVTS